MWVTDNITHDYRVPPNYRYGTTGLTIETEIILKAGRTNFEYKVSVINDQNYPVNGEYWTNIGFAPGSTPGRSKASTEGTYIVTPLEQIMMKPWWDWLFTAEEVIDSNKHIYKFDRLKEYKNWEDQGIWYAYPEVNTDYWGVINRETPQKTGLLRIADNSITTGMKFWSFGARQGEAADQTNYMDQTYWLRPFPELWGGLSQEFFRPTTFDPGENRTWSEFYAPTIGMKDITYSNKNGSYYVDINDEVIDIYTFMNTPELPLEITVMGEESELYSGSFTPSPIECFNVTLNDSLNNYYKIIVTRDGEELLTAEVIR